MNTNDDAANDPRADAIRSDVAKAYAERVTRRAEERRPQDDGLAVAGYSAEALAALPDDATTASFGCGDPVAFAGLRAGDVVIDLGSGAGMDLLLAAEKVGAHGRVIGVDMTDAMIEKASANIRAAKVTNVEVRKGIIEALPVLSGSVDWVISNCVINLSPEKAKVFAEIARVLKPGGQMLVSDIVVENLPEEVRAMPQGYNNCVAGAISEADYLDGLRAAGLTDVAVRGRNVYDADQIEAFAAELDPGNATLASIARGLEGKVWSAKVYARKPESAVPAASSRCCSGR